MNTTRFQPAGFTLTELLVVIAIIGTLAGAIVVNLNSAQQQGRDARRKQDIEALQTALELYYNANGQYPTTSSFVYSAPQQNFQTTLAVLTGGAPGSFQYLSAVPVDPVNNGRPDSGALGYAYRSDGAGSCAGQWYALMYALENENDPLVAQSQSVRIRDCSGATLPVPSSGSTGVVIVGQSYR